MANPIVYKIGLCLTYVLWGIVMLCVLAAFLAIILFPVFITYEMIRLYGWTPFIITAGIVLIAWFLSNIKLG
jgi:beta-lactamase regulating signal transducer with metallopeptidase domain